MAKSTRRPSVMGHKFSEVPNVKIPRSSFDRSHGHKTTFDAGLLIPIYVDEALPGDTFKMRMTAFARLATPIKPLMDNMYMSTFFFAVPYRLVWDNWEKFNGAQDNPSDSTDFLVPQFSGGSPYTNGDMHDFMGIAPGSNTAANSLHARAYNLIWNEWFRDENLQNSVTVDRGDGPDNIADYLLKRRGKRHDYFTSCLPWPQKGDPVSIPLGDRATVLPNTATSAPEFDVGGYGADPGPRRLFSSAGSGRTGGAQWFTDDEGQDNFPAPAPNQAAYWADPKLYADLSEATAVTINDLRLGFQTQKLFERDARGGTRYTEIIRSHFGVISPDARLQRPEYLGGGTTPIIINPIAQTTQSFDTQPSTPQGNLAAIGTAQVHGHGFTKSFTEHCLLVGLVCVDADLTYQQGINRMFFRQTRFDFYWPTLAHLGEQAVLQREIYANNQAGTNENVFGYQERYAEYRYKPSLISGEFRSTHPTSLDVWHLSEELDQGVSLNAAFISSEPPVDRVIAVPTEPHFLFDGYFNLRCARPMPLYSVPGLIDHF